MERYKQEQIFPTAVPEWQKDIDGVWVRYWEIRLAAPVDPNTMANLDRLSEGGILVACSLNDDARTLRVRTRTEQNPFTDEVFYVAAYKMLCAIDEVQRIELIQGQPRDAWQPFRQR